jgi:two-component system response regulator FixJ
MSPLPAGSMPLRRNSPLATTIPVIYIVDDDAAVRDSLRLLLETHDRPVRDFGSPGECLDEVGRAADGCLLLDFHMPAMDGLELLAELRARGVTLPAILITGLCDAKIRRRAEAAGVLGVLEKPFPDDTLLTLVSQALDGAERRARDA